MTAAVSTATTVSSNLAGASGKSTRAFAARPEASSWERLRATTSPRRRHSASTNDARLVLGASVGIGQRTSLLVSASAGLTDESPDFTFSISLPITFRLF